MKIFKKAAIAALVTLTSTLAFADGNGQTGNRPPPDGGKGPKQQNAGLYTIGTGGTGNQSVEGAIGGNGRFSGNEGGGVGRSIDTMLQGGAVGRETLGHGTNGRTEGGTGIGPNAAVVQGTGGTGN